MHTYGQASDIKRDIISTTLDMTHKQAYAYACMMLPCGKPIIWAHWASFALVIIGVLKYSLDIEDATV